MQLPTFQSRIPKLIAFGVTAVMVITLFSLFMAAVASVRNDVARDTYEYTSEIYAGPVDQTAPNLYAEGGVQVPLRSTDGRARIEAEFVKKGLVYQPTFSTIFGVVYQYNTALLSGPVEFVFPIPSQLSGNELSDLRLLVDGSEEEFEVLTTSGEYGSRESLVWKGNVDGTELREFTVGYETVGLSDFNYTGQLSEDPQDFRMDVSILGTRSYNVNSGLSVDEREFGTDARSDTVTLIWDKDNLYSSPQISVSVGERLNPSTQVSRIYLTMAPAYIVFALVIVFLAERFGRGMRLLDFGLTTVLFTVFFPLVHYLSSFTIDPTVELLSGLPLTLEYSMPLYLAFVLAWSMTGGLMVYLAARVHGKGFAVRYMLPVVALFIGFFPFVVTIPEYSMLLVLLGFVAFMAIVVQSRRR